MGKYIDAEKLKAYIEKLFPGSSDERIVEGFEYAVDKVKAIIDSLQQEQPEVDLKEEIASFFSKNPIPYEHITDWPLLKNTALHFYNLGLNARKEN